MSAEMLNRWQGGRVKILLLLDVGTINIAEIEFGRTLGGGLVDAGIAQIAHGSDGLGMAHEGHLVPSLWSGCDYLWIPNLLFDSFFM